MIFQLCQKYSHLSLSFNNCASPFCPFVHFRFLFNSSLSLKAFSQLISNQLATELNMIKKSANSSATEETVAFWSILTPGFFRTALNYSPISSPIKSYSFATLIRFIRRIKLLFFWSNLRNLITRIRAEGMSKRLSCRKWGFWLNYSIKAHLFTIKKARKLRA